MINSDELYKALFNNAAIGIILVNATGTIEAVNAFALRQFGFDELELEGQKIEVLIPTRLSHRHRKHRSNYHRQNPHNRPMGLGMDLLGLRKNGEEFPVEVSLSVYKKDDDEKVIAFVSDITIRKKSEAALLKMNAELEQQVENRTQKLQLALEKEKDLGELKSRFVTMASHQFRTPLSTILSSAYLAGQYKESSEQARRDKHIERIVSSVNTLNGILEDFLNVGKMEEGKILVRLSDFELKPWMESGLAELRTICKTGQQLVYQHEGSDELTADPALLKHIVMNLLSNAIKFSPEHTTIAVKTLLKGKQFTLQVSDEGMGIPAEDVPQLFQRFYRSSNAANVQGTGLGLHIVGKYAELMGGLATCESILGKGTTITISIPQNH